MNAVDTNVLVYAISSDDPHKSALAANLLKTLDWRNSVLLWQVAVEFGAVMTRLHASGRASERALQAVLAIRDRFPLSLPNASVLDRGFQIRQDYGISYWDSMLLAGCVEAGVDRLYSEDLQSRQVIEGVHIVNPFASPAPL